MLCSCPHTSAGAAAHNIVSTPYLEPGRFTGTTNEYVYVLVWKHIPVQQYLIILAGISRRCLVGIGWYWYYSSSVQGGGGGAGAGGDLGPLLKLLPTGHATYNTTCTLLIQQQ